MSDPRLETERLVYDRSKALKEMKKILWFVGEEQNFGISEEDLLKLERSGDKNLKYMKDLYPRIKQVRDWVKILEDISSKRKNSAVESLKARSRENAVSDTVSDTGQEADVR